MIRPSLLLRLGVAGTLLAAIVGASLWRAGLGAEDMAEAVLAIGIALPFGYVILHVAASLLFVPRAWFALAAGYLFGFEWGGVWALCGATAGACAGFLVARFVNGEALDLAKARGVGRWIARAEREGWRAAMIARLIPVLPHSVVNYAFGLSRISLSGYALGSAIGMAPQTLVFVHVGATGRMAAEGSADWMTSAVIGLAMLAATLALPRLFRRGGDPA